MLKLTVVKIFLIYIDTLVFFNISSCAKQSWKKIVTKYFVRTQRKTIRKLDLPSLFNELYLSSFTQKQVLAGFTCAGVWPFDATAMKDRVVQQPLLKKQLHQSSTTK